MNSNEGISPMFIDPIVHKWLVNRVVIQDFDGHQELYEKHEPLLASVIILSIMSIKLMKGGQSQEHEQTGNGYAWVICQGLKHLESKKQAVENGFETEKVVAFDKVLLELGPDLLETFLFSFLLKFLLLFRNFFVPAWLEDFYRFFLLILRYHEVNHIDYSFFIGRITKDFERSSLLH